MTKFGAYKILPHKKLNIEYYRGELNIDDLIYFKKIVRQDPNYNFYWNTILDLRDCKLMIKSPEIKKFVDFMKDDYNTSKPRNLAFLSSSSNEVALSVLYTLIVKSSGINFNTFNVSSIDTLILNFSENIIEKQKLVAILNELQTTTKNIYTLKTNN